jgi:hypothetical protein
LMPARVSSSRMGMTINSGYIQTSGSLMPDAILVQQGDVAS